MSLSFLDDVAIVSAEDAILSKLEWAASAGVSERQLADVRGIVELNPALDQTYIERWAETLGVAELWRSLGGRGGR